MGRFCRRRISGGFSLIEIIVVMMIFALVVTIAVPVFNDYVARADSDQAIADINAIATAIKNYQNQNGDELPPSLAAISHKQKDPWGHDYVYLTLSAAQKGHARKNNNLVPLNTDYDLYSRGPDGDSQTPLTAEVSRDDILRASNGAFIGVAEEY